MSWYIVLNVFASWEEVKDGWMVITCDFSQETKADQIYVYYIASVTSGTICSTRHIGCVTSGTNYVTSGTNYVTSGTNCQLQLYHPKA